VPVPNIDLQRRIVEAIEAHVSHLDVGIESLGRSKRNLNRMERSVLRAAVGGDSVPAGWRVSDLGDEVDVILGQSPPGSSYNSDGRGVPFFQGKAEFGELLPTVRKWTTDPRKLARSGDVLLSVRAPVGPTNLAPSDCSIGRGLAALRPRSHVDGRYLLYWMRATSHLLTGVETGTTFGAVTGNQIRSHPLRLPPIDVQKQIVNHIETQLSSIQSLSEALRIVAARSGALRTSVLRSAFAGRLV
jgi:type I restriction enzyme S subunit